MDAFQKRKPRLDATVNLGIRTFKVMEHRCILRHSDWIRMRSLTTPPCDEQSSLSASIPACTSFISINHPPRFSRAVYYHRPVIHTTVMDPVPPAIYNITPDSSESPFAVSPHVKIEETLPGQPAKKKQKRNKPTLSCEECVERKTKVSSLHRFSE